MRRVRDDIVKEISYACQYKFVVDATVNNILTNSTSLQALVLSLLHEDVYLRRLFLLCGTLA